MSDPASTPAPAHATEPRRPQDWIRRLIGPVATPIYAWAVARRNARFDRGEGVRRVPLPVISVGNLTVGGTGKTPMVMWLCRELQSRGIRPAIALRGYRSEQNPGGVSDEAREYERALPGVPVLVGSDRRSTICDHLGRGSLIDVAVLDDGFQHRQLYRDLDILLIDAQARTLMGDHLLPRGDLREPACNGARAQVVVYTHTSPEHGFNPAPLAPGQHVFCAEHRWTGLDVFIEGQASEQPVAWLRGKRLALVCGIGRPARLMAACGKAGAAITHQAILPDHGPLVARAVARAAEAVISGRADAVLTTAKDVARAGPIPSAWRSMHVVVPRLGLSINDPAGLLDLVERAIRSSASNPTIAR